MINLLNDVELDFHLRLLGAPAIATNLTLVLVVILGIRDIGVGKLDMCNLKVVLGITSSVRADQKTMG